jgi:hypothetical protein
MDREQLDRKKKTGCVLAGMEGVGAYGIYRPQEETSD